MAQSTVRQAEMQKQNKTKSYFQKVRSLNKPRKRFGWQPSGPSVPQPPPAPAKKRTFLTVIVKFNPVRINFAKLNAFPHSIQRICAETSHALFLVQQSSWNFLFLLPHVQ